METLKTTTTRHPAMWCEWDGVLVLDAHGHITFCSTAAARLLGRSEAQLVGQQAASLIPELPFRSHIPEFNLAYIHLHGSNGIWNRRDLLTSDGRPVSLEISLGSLEDVGRRSIVMIVKRHEPEDGATATSFPETQPTGGEATYEDKPRGRNKAGTGKRSVRYQHAEQA